MSGFGRFAAVMIGLLLLTGAQAQDSAGPQNIEAGKTPAQLFASDCAVCHKSPQGLAKGGGLSLTTFLREHYTASRESAAALAAYLKSVDTGAPAASTRASKPRAKPKPPGEAKPAESSKPDDAKAAEGKADDAKATEAKPTDSKPVAKKKKSSKPAEAKPAEAPKSE
ncbi:MAG TPA: hypothetical protein VFB45_18240 [Pseudolabrys sp.]|nr:hypothetical protein [Pseudolabrys sp.]